jgi:hypothetical protein
LLGKVIPRAKKITGAIVVVDQDGLSQNPDPFDGQSAWCAAPPKVKPRSFLQISCLQCCCHVFLMLVARSPER